MGLRALSVATAAGSSLVNTTTETVFNGASYTFPANFFTAGKVVKFDAVIQVIDNNSTDTLQCIVYFGGTTLTTAIATGDAIDVADADFCEISGTIVVRDADASGTCVTQVYITGPDAPGVDATECHSTVTASVDFTSALLLEVSGTWSVAHADNEARMEMFNVYEVAD